VHLGGGGVTSFSFEVWVGLVATPGPDIVETGGGCFDTLAELLLLAFVVPNTNPTGFPMLTAGLPKLKAAGFCGPAPSKPLRQESTPTTNHLFITIKQVRPKTSGKFVATVQCIPSRHSIADCWSSKEG